jgi:DNA (cytosine-5)-methyltransferase 1
VAWHPLRWQAAWYSEIEPFPCAVLKHHYPTVPNYGDMTQYEAWPNEPINLLVGGTPCQSFSVAGLRKGLADPRGNLMLTYGAIAKRYRPRWLVWENVPGVLSSNGGRDFGAFLGMLAELGYGFAYRVLDAQYFGVAQRRRRVFVVGYLGDWNRAAAVLFERHGLQGHPAPSRKAGQEVAGTIAARFGISRNNHEECVAQTLLAPRGGFDLECETPIVAPTLQANDGAKWGSNQWIDEGKAIVQPIGFGAQISVPQVDVDLMQTLQAKNPMAVAQPITQFGNIAGSLTARHDSSPCADRGQNVVAQPVAFEPGSIARNAGPAGESLLAPTLRREMGDNQPAVRYGMQVRRLTPVECERLQGFPDNYTNIPWRKKSESPDGPRYKAMGNSMAVPVMRWIGERIAAVEAL